MTDPGPAQGGAPSPPADPGRGTRRLGCALIVILGAAAAGAVYLLRPGPPVERPLPPGPCAVRRLADELDRAEVSGDRLRHGVNLPAAQTRIMGGTFLRSIVASPSQRIVFETPLENARRIDFSAALLHARPEGEAAPVTFRVLAIAPGGAERVLAERTLDPETDAREWHSGSAQLVSADVEGCRLALLTEPGAKTGEGFPTHLPVWGAPTVVSGGEPRNPNVVLIALPGMRADKLSCLGGRPRVTPNIDALGARGLVAESVICPSPSPRVGLRALLTGLGPGALALGEGDEMTRLKRYIGLEKLPVAMRGSGRLAAGFTGGREASALFGGLLGEFDRMMEFTAGGDTLSAQAAAAAGFIEPRRHDPFFVFLYSKQVLPPWTDSRYAGKSPSERISGGFGRPDGPEAYEGFKPTPEEIEYTRALYDGDVASADEAVGRLVDTLSETGLLERTIVAVTSTCGAELFERDWWGTGHGMTEEFLRVPLVMAGPGVAKRRIAGPVRLESVAPALLGAAKATATLGGRSPAPVAGAAGVVVVSGWPQGGEWRWAVRAGRWKLVADAARGKRSLYHLPDETRDFSRERAEIAETLSAEIERYIEWSARAAKSDPARAGAEDYAPSEEAKGLAAPEVAPE